MLLLLGDKFSPDMRESLGPAVGTFHEDVVGHDVIVAQIRDDGYDKIVRGIAGIDVFVLAKDLHKFVHKKLI